MEHGVDKVHSVHKAWLLYIVVLLWSKFTQPGWQL